MTTRIYLNGRFLSQRVTGVQRYAIETLRALDELICEQPPQEIVPILAAPRDARELPLRAIEFRRVGASSGHVWEQLTYPWVARDGLMWSFAATGPLLARDQAVTIHDATVAVHPESFSWRFRLAYRVAMPWLARRAAQVLTVSEFSRHEVARHYGVASAQLRVSGEGFEHAARVAADTSILVKAGLASRPFVLAVSSVTPHKNFGVVLRALAELRDMDIRLVIAGALDGAVFAAVDREGLRSAAHLGYVSDAELRALYEHAAVFVFPSLYEGFGLPLVEAMSFGCPVIASRRAAIPEVCGDAARYFEPTDAHALAALIRQVIDDPSERTRMVARGRAQLSQHGWRRAAEVHLEAMREAAMRLRSSRRLG